MARPRQVPKERVLEAINRWLIDHGVPPTIEELRRRLGVGSTRTVLRYLRELEEAGDIDRWSGARGVRPRRAAESSVETRPVPIVGEAPAGPLMLAEENREGWVQLPKRIAPTGSNFFLLRVRGDSMNRAKLDNQRIENGDLVLVRQQSQADPGQIVVILIDGQATIKRIARSPGYYVLKPESSNPDHRPVILDEEFQIQGVVTRVFKKGANIIN